MACHVKLSDLAILIVGIFDGSGKRGYSIITWGWLSPGGLRGLQNRLKGAAEAALVGSTPIHSRTFSSL
jgi:hypothetical protein